MDSISIPLLLYCLLSYRVDGAVSSITGLQLTQLAQKNVKLLLCKVKRRVSGSDLPISEVSQRFCEPLSNFPMPPSTENSSIGF